MIIREEKRALNPNLTFEEFYALANGQPNLKGNWIYKVTQAMYDNDLKYPYPKFDLNYSRECYFKTFRNAEIFVKGHRTDVYCSWITQLPCGINHEEGVRGAEWLYDQNGEILDYTITNVLFGKAEDFTFFGRPKSRQRFKVGDIVEVVSNKDVRLAVLNHQIPDVKWCWNIYRNCQKKNEIPYFLDSSDDSAVVIEGPNYFYHDHVGALQLLKPRFPIPEDILNNMLTWNARCNKDDDPEPLKSCEPFIEERKNEKGEPMGEFYELTIYLHLEEDTKFPHLHINDHYGLKVAFRIDRPLYYDHDDYNGRLTNNQIQDLYRYLSHKDLEKSRWWYMIRNWNENHDNPNMFIPLETPLPNYLDLIEKS